MLFHRILGNAQSNIRSNTYNLLTRVTTWPAFSHHMVGDGGSTSNSLEGIHDGIHIYVRGNGQMGNPAVAGKVFLLSLSSFYLTWWYYRIWPHLFLALLQCWQVTLSLEHTPSHTWFLWQMGKPHNLQTSNQHHGGEWDPIYKCQIDITAENKTWFYSVHFADQSKDYPCTYEIEAVASPYYEKWLGAMLVLWMKPDAEPMTCLIVTENDWHKSWAWRLKMCTNNMDSIGLIVFCGCKNQESVPAAWKKMY